RRPVAVPLGAADTPGRCRPAAHPREARTPEPGVGQPGAILGAGHALLPTPAAGSARDGLCTSHQPRRHGRAVPAGSREPGDPVTWLAFATPAVCGWSPAVLS